jgi:hypothetical protein
MLVSIQVVLQHHSHIPVDRLPEWMNAVGLLVSNLPEPYWHGLHAKLERMLASPALAHWPHPNLTPTQLFDFNEVHALKTDTSLAYLMATAHATWHHAGFNQLCGILDVGEFGLVLVLVRLHPMAQVGPLRMCLAPDVVSPHAGSTMVSLCFLQCCGTGTGTVGTVTFCLVELEPEPDP